MHQLPALVENAITYLVYELGLEVIEWTRSKQLTQYLNNVHKYIYEAHKEKEIKKTDLHFADQFRKLAAPDSSTQLQAAAHDLQQMWIAMLRNLPGMSVEVSFANIEEL